MLSARVRSPSASASTVRSLVEVVVLVAVANRLERPIALRASADVVPGDPAQPGSDRRPGRIVAPGIAHDREKDLLGHVLGDRRRRRHVQREAVHLSLTASKQLGECLGIPGRHAGDQLAVLKLV